MQHEDDGLRRERPMRRHTKQDRTQRPDAEEVVVKPAPKPAPNGQVDEQTIRLRAYERWEAAGRPEGDGVQFWLEAEKELAAH
jgi:hypothetical protein